MQPQPLPLPTLQIQQSLPLTQSSGYDFEVKLKVSWRPCLSCLVSGGSIVEEYGLLQIVLEGVATTVRSHWPMMPCSRCSDLVVQIQVLQRCLMGKDTAPQSGQYSLDAFLAPLQMAAILPKCSADDPLRAPTVSHCNQKCLLAWEGGSRSPLYWVSR